MKKFLKSRTAIGILSIVLALVISFGITPLLNNAMKKQTEIVRATKDIRKGEEITKDKITKVKVGAYNLPNNIIKEPNEIIGSFAMVDVHKDDYFLSSKISKSGGYDNYLMGFEEEDMAISITIKSLASGLSGKLRPGDIVSIISTSDSELSPTVIPELQYVEVLSVSTKEGGDAESGKEDKLPSTITLSVKSIQAEKLVEHEQNGNIHFALVYRGNEKKAKEFIKMQEEYLEELKVLELEMEEEGEDEDGESEEGENQEEISDAEIENQEETEEPNKEEQQ